MKKQQTEDGNSTLVGTPHVAINCRIPSETHEKMQSSLEVTQKSTAAFVKDAIMEYIAQIEQSDYKPSRALQIDQFAYQLKHEGE
jgi:hypothetical protein